jgi:hypothetical protein
MKSAKTTLEASKGEDLSSGFSESGLALASGKKELAIFTALLMNSYLSYLLTKRS